MTGANEDVQNLNSIKPTGWVVAGSATATGSMATESMMTAGSTMTDSSLSISNSGGNSDGFRVFIRISRAAAVLSFALGVSILLGWILKIPALASTFAGTGHMMKTNVSICFVSCGISLFLSVKENCTTMQKWVTKASSMVACLIAILTLLEYLLGRNLGIDEFFFKDTSGYYFYPNRMGPSAALTFLLNGIALLSLNIETKNGRRPAQFLSLLGMFFPLHSLIAHAYGVPTKGYEGFIRFLVTPLAISSSAVWLLLSIGILFARSDRGIMRVLTRDRETARTSLQLLLASLIVPTVVGLGAFWAVQNWNLPPRIDYSLLSVACTTIFTIVVWRSAIQTHRIHEERDGLFAAAKEAIIAAKQATELRDNFLSVASHELKTPLTSLRLQVDSLQRSVAKFGFQNMEPERIDKALRVSSRQIESLSNLIDELLDVSRIANGKLQLHFQKVNLGKLAKDVFELFGEQLGEVRQSSEISAEDVEGDWDYYRIQQVILNLLSNARKYGEGRPIELHVRRKEGVAELQVRDRGAGISPDLQARIFDRFERGAAEGSSSISGLGLGLYITKEIVNAHGGSIRVESQIGHGAVFTVELPIERHQA
jgi:signal transduction histidine kinase